MECCLWCDSFVQKIQRIIHLMTLKMANFHPAGIQIISKNIDFAFALSAGEGGKRNLD